MNVGNLTVNVRVLVNGVAVPLWRVRLFGLCARLLGVPLKLRRPIRTTTQTVTISRPLLTGADGDATLREFQRALDRQPPLRVSNLS